MNYYRYIFYALQIAMIAFATFGCGKSNNKSDEIIRNIDGKVSFSESLKLLSIDYNNGDVLNSSYYIGSEGDMGSMSYKFQLKNEPKTSILICGKSNSFTGDSVGSMKIGKFQIQEFDGSYTNYYYNDNLKKYIVEPK